MAEEKGTRVMKVLLLDKEKKPIAEGTQQLPVDPFADFTQNGLQQPPFPQEQLLYLAETHPLHSAALEQKTSDVVGTGWEWHPTKDDADEKQRDELEAWFRSLYPTGEPTPEEALYTLQDDVETFSQGYIEVARDPQGVVRRLYTVPSHSIRFHHDGARLAQVRGGNNLAWFKRWGVEDTRYVDKRKGFLHEKVDHAHRANELLVVRRRSRRSSWYGVPTYISAIGWLTLALAARDDNLMFFSNRREPRWAIILTNLEEDDALEDDLQQAFAVDLAQPHKNVIIPIAGKGDVHFQKMTTDRMDGSFSELSDRADAAILVAHRMPPERIGMAKVGPLGGNMVIAASRVYKEAVVAPAQAILASRLNAFLEREFPRGGNQSKDPKPLDWKWHPKELDLQEDREIADQTEKLWRASLITLDEARSRLKMPVVTIGEDEAKTPDPKGAMYYHELTGAAGQADVDARQKLEEINGKLTGLLGEQPAPE